MDGTIPEDFQRSVGEMFEGLDHLIPNGLDSLSLEESMARTSEQLRELNDAMLEMASATRRIPIYMFDASDVIATATYKVDDGHVDESKIPW